VLLGISLVFKQWRWLWVIVPLLLVTWLLSLILRWSPRYKALEFEGLGVSDTGDRARDVSFFVCPRAKRPEGESVPQRRGGRLVRSVRL
jgi:hypothetical protein